MGSVRGIGTAIALIVFTSATAVLAWETTWQCIAPCTADGNCERHPCGPIFCGTNPSVRCDTQPKCDAISCYFEPPPDCCPPRATNGLCVNDRCFVTCTSRDRCGAIDLSHPDAVFTMCLPQSECFGRRPGDCNRDGQVRVNELTKIVGIALGLELPRACPTADLNDDGQVTIDEIFSAIGSLLQSQ